MKNNNKFVFSLLTVGLMVSACSGTGNSGLADLTASGTISVKSVNIAPEISGKISDILVSEGEEVKAGELLFSIDNSFIQAQYDQANAAVISAQAALDTANVQLRNVQLQQQLTIQNARLQFSDALNNEWGKNPSNNFDLPVWYFTREEKISSSQKLVDETKTELGKQIATLNDLLSDFYNGEFVGLEKELAEAQTTYLAADAARKTAVNASENKEMKQAAEDNFDLSETNLEAIQKQYDQALSTEDAVNILEARGKVGAAQAMYDAAINQLQSHYIGDDSLQVQTAITAVELAEKNVSQAEAGLAQAQAALKIVEIQLEKVNVKSPFSGTVLAQNLEIGEMIGAGGIVMTVGNIDQVSLTVYIPEDKYGLVRLGQEVLVKVDSFPSKTYIGSVKYISDTAEFTPSNVQTVEGRKSTVFSVDITIENLNRDLKPGMPADVTFILE